MLTAILVVLTAILWCGIVLLYFRGEITRWWDNRYGPDHKEEKPFSNKKKFWQLYD
jgi:NADH:ubiquinone oxidoreductase subunit H